MKEEKPLEKKIHISLPANVHQRLRVKCALKNTTLQEYVEDLIKEVTKDVVITPNRDRVSAQDG